MDTKMEQKFAELEKKYKRLQRSVIAIPLLFAALFTLFSFYKVDKFNIIRAKGIILEDENGRDRILIGAPVPYSKDRVRTDLKKVEAQWAKEYGKDYMKWYKDYYHGTYGMIVMDDKGIDKLLVGDKLADPNVGKRISDATGITWNDENGMERGGLGLQKIKGTNNYRGVLGFDDNQGGEGFHLAQFEDGSQMLRMVHDEGYILLGQAKPNGFFNKKEPFIGIMAFDKNDNIIYENNFLKTK